VPTFANVTGVPIFSPEGQGEKLGLCSVVRR